MFKSSRHLSAGWPLLLFSLCLLLLNACVQATPPGPSTALKQQFAQMQQQQQQQAEQIKELQARLDQLLQQKPAAVASTPAEQAFNAPAEQVTIPAAIRQELSEVADSASNYLAAFSSLAAGHNELAEAGFRQFLANYPDHQYSPNARYWLASAQFSQGKLRQAAENLQQVAADLNDRQRAPSALAMLIKIYRQQQLPLEADETLEQLRNRYPDSSEAQQFFQAAEPQQ